MKQAAIVAALLVGCGEDGVPLPWSHMFSVPPGTFVEANLLMSSGDAASCQFDAHGAVLDWNTHGHFGDGGLQLFTEGQGASGAIPFSAPAGGGYSFYFQNCGSQTATLDVTITGRGRVVSTSVGP